MGIFRSRKQSNNFLSEAVFYFDGFNLSQQEWWTVWFHQEITWWHGDSNKKAIHVLLMKQTWSTLSSQPVKNVKTDTGKHADLRGVYATHLTGLKGTCVQLCLDIWILWSGLASMIIIIQEEMKKDLSWSILDSWSGLAIRLVRRLTSMPLVGTPPKPWSSISSWAVLGDFGRDLGCLPSPHDLLLVVLKVRLVTS